MSWHCGVSSAITSKLTYAPNPEAFGTQDVCSQCCPSIDGFPALKKGKGVRVGLGF